MMREMDERSFKLACNALTPEIAGSWTPEEWIEATKNYYVKLLDVQKKQFRQNKFGKGYFIKACKDPKFVSKVLRSDFSALNTDGTLKLLDAVESFYTIRKGNWNYDPSQACPQPADIKISLKEKYLFETSRALLNAATEEDLHYAMKENKGLFKFEKEFIKSLFCLEMQERVLVEREKMKAEAGEIEPFKHNEPNKRNREFFEKNPKWRSFEKVPSIYAVEIMNLFNRHNDVDSFALFERTMGKEGLKDFVEKSIFDGDRVEFLTYLSQFNENPKWFKIYQDSCVNLLEKGVDSSLKATDKEINIKAIFSKLVIYGQSLAKLGGGEEYSLDKSKVVAQNMHLHLKTLTVMQDDSHNPIAEIMRLHPTYRKEFHPHLMCALLEKDGFLPQLLYAENTIRYDLVKIKDNLNVSKDDVMKELFSASLEDNIKTHQLIESNFEIKIHAHPFLKKMMIDEALSTDNMPSETCSESSGSSFKL